MTRDQSPISDKSGTAALINGNSAFAFDLYRALKDSEDNLFFSPYSISLALAMVYAGARGDTKNQMEDTLHFALPQELLHAAFNAVDLSLTGKTQEGGENEGFLLNVANSVWTQEGYGFLPDYLDTLALNYGEQVRPLDFSSDPEGASDRINEWVADATEERITNLLSPDAITNLTRLVLANAIYFNASWHSTFDERDTESRPFYMLDGSELEVPMMHQESRFRYAAGNGYEAVALPYKDREMDMTILLPDTGNFHEFEESLSADSVRAILDGLENERVRLAMPKFKMESSFSLSDTLKNMGMPDAFSSSAANFSGMDGRSCQTLGDICLFISNVLHKAFVSVDEAGTEAAATTAVTIGVTSVEVQPEPIELIVDRPFLFIIRHQATGAILFVGRVLSP